MVTHLFQILGHQRAQIFFLEFLDEAVDQYGGRFLFQITEFAREFAGKCQRFAIHNREFLAELFVFALEVLGGNRFEFAFVH